MNILCVASPDHRATATPSQPHETRLKNTLQLSKPLPYQFTGRGLVKLVMTQTLPRFEEYWLSLSVPCSSEAESLCFSLWEAPAGLSESGISPKTRISSGFIHDLSTFSFRGWTCPILSVKGKQLTPNYGSMPLSNCEIAFKVTKK